eukprot:361251-Chlamydomonas_euryale.AAC.8
MDLRSHPCMRATVSGEVSYTCMHAKDMSHACMHACMHACTNMTFSYKLIQPCVTHALACICKSDCMHTFMYILQLVHVHAGARVHATFRESARRIDCSLAGQGRWDTSPRPHAGSGAAHRPERVCAPQAQGAG